MSIRLFIGMLATAAFALPSIAEPVKEVGVWNQSKWDQCLWDSEEPVKVKQEPRATRSCNNPLHYTPEGKHVFVLDESQLGNGDVLAPDPQFPK